MDKNVKARKPAADNSHIKTNIYLPNGHICNAAVHELSGNASLKLQAEKKHMLQLDNKSDHM